MNSKLRLHPNNTNAYANRLSSIVLGVYKMPNRFVHIVPSTYCHPYPHCTLHPNSSIIGGPAPCCSKRERLVLLLLLSIGGVARAKQSTEPTLPVRSLTRLARLLFVLHQSQRSHTLACHGARCVAPLQAPAWRRRCVDVPTCASRCARCARHDACGVDLPVLRDVLLS